MNKNDGIMIGVILILCLLSILIFAKWDKKGDKIAIVYYQDEVILTIDLAKNEKKDYQVMGKNGTVIIEVNQDKIRVKQENSPLHICSKQGYISKNTESIVCLPNQIVIQIQTKNAIDTVVH